MPRSFLSSRSHRRLLLAGVSVFTLLAAIGPAQAGAALDALGARGGTSAAASAQAAAQAAAQASAAVSQQSRQNVTRALDALRAAQIAQAAARQAAAGVTSLIGGPAVTNGLGAGGLNPGGGAVISVDGASVDLSGTTADTWQGVDSVRQSLANGKTDVTVKQSQQKAILTWKEFNVGRDTSLTFDQADSSYVALNRVTGGDTAPSQILGSVSAKGSVYVVNQNGIIFGGASQVNVHSLIASTADITNAQFLNNGIYSTNTSSPSFTGAGDGTNSDYAGLVRVDAGAEITTNTPESVTEGGGFVLLMGKTVENAGTITTPKGQAELAAGDSFVIRKGYATDANQSSTMRGNEIAPAGTGSVTNSGIIFAQQGDVTLAAQQIVQQGILLATTSVDTRGTIHLLSSAATGTITLGTGSLTQILPELDTADTALNSKRDAVIKASQDADLLRSFQDRLDQSRIEITTGGDVVFQNGSLTMAQGGQVAVTAGHRITAETGSVIDVSGTASTLAMSANQILVNIQGNELRDSPLNRDSDALKNENVWIDARDLVLVPAGTGGYKDDRTYTKGGLLEVSGHLDNTDHTIGEWTAIGGTITLAAPEVVAQAGSVFNLSGGAISYAPGTIRLTNLLGADGRVYTVNDAPADMLFVGMGDEILVNHARWGVAETYRRPFGLGRETTVEDPGYTVGRDAGNLILTTPTSIFEGTIVADAFIGERQIEARPDGVTDGYKLGQTQAPLAGRLTLSGYRTFVNSDGITGTTVAVPIDSTVVFSNDAPPADRTNTAWFDADQINSFGLGGITVETSRTIAVKDDLKLADGGAFNLRSSQTIDIAADLTVRSGSVKTGAPTNNGTTGAQGAVTVREGVTIDTRGVFTNLLLDPTNLAGLAFLDGGDVILEGNVTLEQGSLIDASGGGSVSQAGKITIGKGGDISLAAPVSASLPTDTGGSLTLGGTLRSNGRIGGALTIQANDILIADAGTPYTPDFFRQGFSSYAINGRNALTVAPGTEIAVAQPVWQANATTYSAATGANPADAFALILDPLYLENPVTATLTQRAGASLTLTSASRPNDLAYGGLGGSIDIGTGSHITVDPGQSVSIVSGGQITVDGAITAHSGKIDILNLPSVTDLGLSVGGDPGARSIWIGGNARLDVSAQAYTALDSRGRSYGVVPDGGSITLGSREDLDAITQLAYASDAFIVIRPGAELNADGASATIDITTGPGSGLPGSTSSPHAVASNGGAIAMRSFFGIYNDGTLSAEAGGPGAAGGTLALVLESPYLPSAPVDRVLTVSQNYVASGLSASLQPGEADANLAIGARISASQIEGGGFDNVSLWGRTAILFEGDVSLHAGQSLALYKGAIADASPTGRVNLDAPYILLAGQTSLNPLLNTFGNNWRPTYTASVSGLAFDATADLIDVRDIVRPIFADATLTSRGDIRFLETADTLTIPTAPAPAPTILAAPGNLNLIARQLYPDTNAQVRLFAGATSDINSNPWAAPTFRTDSRLTIGSIDGVDPGVPYSVFGTIELWAAIVRQGGILRAPLGTIMLGVSNGNANGSGTALTELLPDSITSVSAKGLIMPYGGTTDGVTYTVNGGDPIAPNLFTGELKIGSGTLSSATGVYLNGITIASDAGSLLDLSGGGVLTGAGFISGRGGSVDVLTTPLVNANLANAYSASGNKVYAIVPGAQLAPTGATSSGAWTGNLPGIGQQIKISAGVPGLPEGTYTLLPASYALLPGAFRVEIGAKTTTPVAGAVALPNGSYVASGVQGIAHTPIVNALANQIIVTPSKPLRNYSQYNEQSYADFQLAQAATFGTMRALLPGDGKFLTVNLNPLASGSTSEPGLIFDGTTDMEAVDGYYGGYLVLTASGELVITGPDSTTQRTSSVTTVSAAAINAIGAPNLYIGIAPRATYDIPANPKVNGMDFYNQYNGGGEPTKITLERGAVLRGSQIVLVTSQNGSIVINPDAGISTLGGTVSAPDLSTGYLFNPEGRAVLAASNGEFGFSAIPPSGASIEVKDGGSVYAEGSISFVAGSGVTFGGSSPKIGARNLTLELPWINIGDLTGAAVPDGLNLDQALLNRLLFGDPLAGAPAVERLILSASKSINFYGSADLDARSASGGHLKEFVLQSPAIYGYGDSPDAVRISADTLVWNGKIDRVGSTWDSMEVSGKPGGIIPGGPGTGQGTFTIDADHIVFGYPDRSRPSGTLTLDRLMLGFREVNFNASDSITANQFGSLSVYQSTSADPSDSFDPATFSGTGGRLNLNTPLLTAEAGAVMAYHAGGAVSVVSAWGTSTATPSALGGTISITGGDTVTVASAIVLPSGKLSITAANDILLTNTSRLDLSGQAIPMFDVTEYSWGGDVELESTHGNITQQGDSTIDISAANNDAGTLKLTATDAATGRVLLGGTLRGNGGAGYAGGSFDIRAQLIGATGNTLTADFAALNARLNDAGFFGGRSFVLKQGSLLEIGNELKAHSVTISVDGGSLTVNGTIDASGATPGTIRLAAKDGLTLASTAVLDAHGTVLQVDSDGQPIEAKNRGTIELTTKLGTLTLDIGAQLDVSVTSPQGALLASLGRIDLNVPRIDEIGGDARVNAANGIVIRGANAVALNAFWTYAPTDSAGTIVQDATASDVPAGAVGLKQIDAQNTLFMNAALQPGSSLLGRIPGLVAYDQTFHLRPGVEITSSAQSGGNLTVTGDIDLSRYRYASLNPNSPKTVTYGSGEPMALVIRASGDLTVNGSISDGFSPVTSSPLVVAPMLAPGSLSASIRLVSGADLGAADTRVLQSLGTQSYNPGGVTFGGYTDITTSSNFNFNAATDWGWGFNADFYADFSAQVYYFADNWTIPNNAFYRTLAEWQYLQGFDGRYYAPGAIVPRGTAFRAYSWMFDANAPLPSLATSVSVERAGYTGTLLLDDPHAGTTWSIPSVIRTGTGNLELLAASNLVQNSLFGIYTAGAQITVPAGYTAPSGSYYTDHGGNLLITAQRDLGGFASAGIAGPGYNAIYSNQVSGNWLVSTILADGTGAWSVRFGANASDGTGVLGFTGFGALGGGNVTILVGGDAGTLKDGSGGDLVAAVGSTGFVNGDVLSQTGGGNLTVTIGGRLNPGAKGNSGVFTDLRGDILIGAGAIGTVPLTYDGSGIPNDPRGLDPYAPTNVSNSAWGGPVVMPGDGEAVLRTRGGLVLDGTGNPIQPASQYTGFSLWRDDTAISLFSAGGNLVPYNGASVRNLSVIFADSTKYIYLLPPTFNAVAAGGSIFSVANNPYNFELLPAPRGQLEFLARDSIYGQSTKTTYWGRWYVSGATTAGVTSSPFRPGALLNRDLDRVTGLLHAGDYDPIRIYAVNGDITNFALGEQPTNAAGSVGATIAAKAAQVRAGRDIVNFGNFRSLFGAQALTPSVVMNVNDTDVSLISAGRDMFYTNVLIAGPGLLEVSAGRNLYQGDNGIVTSIGPIAAGDSRLGASVVMTAGAGANGPDYAALTTLYLDPANLATAGVPLADQPGKVAKTYEDELIAWLKERYGRDDNGNPKAAGLRFADDGSPVVFDTSVADPLAFFARLAPEQRAIFLRQVYYAELTAGGREYNDPSSSRYGSYLRGRSAIAVLFPDDAAYGGSITMFGGSGVRTQFGGGIQMLAPAGQIIIGVEALDPGAGAGVVTQGSGDVQMYSKGSILLGLSRIMTTFGGDILAWSAEGDINAGRGAKTTVIYTPAKRVYDDYGNVTLSPVAPSSGAGIATLNPIPEVPAGDIDLIAPLGTIDAGEAGIRVSGNVNIAALHVVNAANIQVQGTSMGLPVAAAAPNVGAMTAASNTAGSAAAAADEASRSSRQTGPRISNLPSIITVEVIGYGGVGSDEGTRQQQQFQEQERQRRLREQHSYNRNSVIQLVGNGALSDAQKQALTPEERKALGVGE